MRLIFWAAQSLVGAEAFSVVPGRLHLLSNVLGWGRLHHRSNLSEWR